MSAHTKQLSSPIRLGFCFFLQGSQPFERLSLRRSAHLKARVQSRTATRTLRLAENRAPKVISQLNAGNPCGFTVRHTRNRARDRGGDTTRSAPNTTLEGMRACHENYLVRYVRYWNINREREPTLVFAGSFMQLDALRPRMTSRVSSPSLASFAATAAALTKGSE